MGRCRIKTPSAELIAPLSLFKIREWPLQFNCTQHWIPIPDLIPEIMDQLMRHSPRLDLILIAELIPAIIIARPPL